MRLFQPRSLVRAGHLRLGPVAIAAALALAAGCEQTPVYHVGLTDGGNQGGDAGNGGAGGGGAGNGGTSATTSGGSGSSGTSGTSGTAGTGGTGTPTPQPATFTVSLDKTSSSMNLADKVKLTVTVQPNGYTGPVDLTASGFGAGITAKLAATTVTLDGTTSATTELALATVSSTPPGDTSFKVSGTVEGGTNSTDGTLTVKSDITVVIPLGVDQMQGTLNNPNQLAFGDYPIKIAQPVGGISAQNPVTLRFYNADNKPHQIHAGQDSKGFPHDPGDIQPMSMDPLVRELNAVATYNWYLHDEGGATTVGQIVIQ